MVAGRAVNALYLCSGGSTPSPPTKLHSQLSGFESHLPYQKKHKENIMRKIIEYFKSLFCHHNFEIIREVAVYKDYWDKIPSYHKLVSRCKKCGYIKVDRL